MYQSPTAAHGFNHQSLFRQPVSNLRQIHEIVWNRNNETQQMSGGIPYAYSSIPNQQSVSEYANIANRVYASANLNNAGIDNHGNSLANNLSQTTEPDYLSTRQPRPTNTTSNTNQNRLSTRESSVGPIPEPRNIPSQGILTLSNSRSAGTINDYIQKERKAHTMAPLTRISGPRAALQANTFASTTAPSDAQTMKLSYLTQTMPQTIFNSYSQSNAAMTDVVNDNNRGDVNEGGEDDDDDAPIIVKVRYDPDAGGPPSEDVIRQALDNQLKGQSSSKLTKDPIVLNFLNHPTQPQISQNLTRPQPPIFNRTTVPVSKLITGTHHRIPVPSQQQTLQSLQRRQQQYEQFLQQQRLQQQLQQQQLQLQDKQRQQQEVMLQQEQQRQQQEVMLQQEQQRQQQEVMLQQEQQRQQQEVMLQQEQQRQQQQQMEEQQRQQQQQEVMLQQQKQEQQRRRQQELILQQKKQKQQLEQFLQQQQQSQQQQAQVEQQKIQQESKIERQQIQQLIQQQLQFERQQQQQQRYRQLLQQQQQQRQQQLLQRNQQQQSEQKQNSSLPPMGPRPSRTISSIQPTTMNQSPDAVLQSSNLHPVQSFPLAPIPLRTPRYISTITIPKLLDRNTSSTLAVNPLPTGLDAYNNYSQQYTPNTFMPIQFGGPTDQQFASPNNNNIFNVPQNLLQRPHTAPSSTEMFRPPSTLDTPELSQENLLNMLEQIPGLRGRRFSIEYAGPTEPVSFPIPSPLVGANATYPEAVVVNELPNNIIQHVRSSNNLELKAALDPTAPPKKTVQSTTQAQPATSSKLKEPPSKVLKHRAQPKQKVKQSRPVSSDDSEDSDDFDSTTTETFTSDEETETETESESEETETETESESEESEIVALSKH